MVWTYGPHVAVCPVAWWRNFTVEVQPICDEVRSTRHDTRKKRSRVLFLFIVPFRCALPLRGVSLQLAWCPCRWPLFFPM